MKVKKNLIRRYDYDSIMALEKDPDSVIRQRVLNHERSKRRFINKLEGRVTSTCFPDLLHSLAVIIYYRLPYSTGACFRLCKADIR